MREHKTVSRLMASKQYACYRSDMRRECVVSPCHDINDQRLRFEARMIGNLFKAGPMAHREIGVKILAHLTGPVRPEYA